MENCMTREEKFNILCAAIQGLIAADPHHLIGEEGCGDAPFAIVDSAFEILNAVRFAEEEGLLDDNGLRDFYKKEIPLKELAFKSSRIP
jgi:hypothetical protein